MWDLAGREHREANTLFQLAEQWELSLITPYGESTREAPGQQPFIINLAWVSTIGGRPAAVHGGTADFVGSDHRPQIL